MCTSSTLAKCSERWRARRATRPGDIPAPTTSDVVFGREKNIGGPAWQSLPLWREQSPFYRSEKLRTPILLTYGEKDYRVPLNNALEFWTVLQRQDVPSRLVVFPDENHWVLKGENSRYFYQEVHGWLAKYL